MAEIRLAKSSDLRFWMSLDAHLRRSEFERMVRDHRGYVLSKEKQSIALLRYNLFWDEIPFCNMVIVEAESRDRGYGRQLFMHWEGEMRKQGYNMVLTSTRVDETAQHFYRRLGYRDCGGLWLDIKGHEQPTELFMMKAL